MLIAFAMNLPRKGNMLCSVYRACSSSPIPCHESRTALFNPGRQGCRCQSSCSLRLSHHSFDCGAKFSEMSNIRKPQPKKTGIQMVFKLFFFFLQHQSVGPGKACLNGNVIGWKVIARLRKNMRWNVLASCCSPPGTRSLAVTDVRVPSGIVFDVHAAHTGKPSMRL